MSKNIKPKIKVNKLNSNPLFIKFLNWTEDKFYIENILNSLLADFLEESDKLAIHNKLKNLDEEYLNSLSVFKKKFKEYMVQSIIAKTLSEEFLAWLSNAFKYIEETVETYLNDEIRTIKIKDSGGRWFEGIICYNFIMTFNYFSLDIIKVCPICKNFFAHKGKYAKYCSDPCKEIGTKKG